MSFKVEFSPFKSAPLSQRFVQKSLDRFYASPLALSLSETEQKAAKPLAERIKKRRPLFVFAFGGAGAVSSFLSDRLPHAGLTLADQWSARFIGLLSGLSKAQLKTAGFVFISSSGKTEEILPFQKLLKRIYKKNQLSLKGRLFALTQQPSNPLGQWAERSKGLVMPLKSLLPGRFSFFNLSGFLQASAFGLKFKAKALGPDKQSPLLAEFFIHHLQKKEIFICAMDPVWRSAVRWLNMSWSESLFKEGLSKTPPSMKEVSFYDLRHGIIEELVFKKNSALLLALGQSQAIKGHSATSPEAKIKNLLREKNIPFLFIRPGKARSCFFQFPALFYKILFCAGDYFGANIYTQTYVDYLKKKSL